jgi:formylglycine-generating enzyme required for sulfatase activity
MRTITRVVAVVFVLAGLGLVIRARCGSSGSEVQCKAGLVAVGARCCATSSETAGVCERSCAPAPKRVAIPETSLTIGSSDWEAEGRVPARAIHVRPFYLDAYEVTAEALACPTCPRGPCVDGDHARAANKVARAEAFAFCNAKGGRLPTDDEWIAAAAGEKTRRYPWGDTGAVCRRGAWGLVTGPCSNEGTGPDTIGAHPDGATPTGLFDMSGNVAEWVASPALMGIARGGSWRTALATELRPWVSLELDPKSRDDRVGFRCAYDSP